MTSDMSNSPIGLIADGASQQSQKNPFLNDFNPFHGIFEEAFRAAETSLNVCDVRDFVRMAIPPRDELMSPWLESAALAMIFAARGVGKTHFAMYIAHALATGSAFLKWHVKDPVPVLYLDGEMPAAALQTRWRALIKATGKEPAAGMMKLVSRDLQPDAELPNLATRGGQEKLAAQFGDARVIILDNLSSLIHGAKENEAEGWEPVGQWAIKQRALGKTIIFIHHAGKNGGQRGTSKREDLLDVVINLQRPIDYAPEQGARFSVHFEKARSLHGAHVAPFEAHLRDDSEGIARWTVSDNDASEKLRLLHEQGLSLAEIGAELGCDKSTVSRRLAKLKATA